MGTHGNRILRRTTVIFSASVVCMWLDVFFYRNLYRNIAY